MSKIRLNFLFFGIFSLLFILFINNKVSASGYEANVTEINNLIYGNSVKSASIKGNSTIRGTFAFSDSDLILDSAGTQNFEILFIPNDINYEVKRINVSGEVAPRRVYISFDSLIYKQYDGTLNIDLPAYNYVGIINDEVEISGNLVATLVSAFPAENTEIVLSGISLSGEKANNYFLDLDNYRATIYPSVLEKSGENATVIELDKNVYVDVNYTLRTVKEEVDDSIGNKYTAFLKYSYMVYNHLGNLSDVSGKYKVAMVLDEEIMNKERLELFELKSDNSYKKLDYRYDKGKIYFQIDSDSSFVLAKRDIEYNFIITFGGILLVSLVFVIIYYKKNSKIESNRHY